MRRDGDPAGVAGASVARWLLRILVATAVVVVGLALAATTAQADVKPAPLGSPGKLSQTVRSAGGPAKAKAAVRSTVPKAKIRVKAQATPARRVARKAAPVRTYRVAKATRTVVRKAAPVRTYRAKATRTVVRKAAPVRTRISTGQRKTSPRPTVRTIRKATAPKARQAQPAKTSPTKINSSPSKITKSSVRKAATAQRLTSTEAVKVAQAPRVKAQDRVTRLTQPSAELALTVPAVEVADPSVDGVRVPAVVTPEIKVTVGDSVELSAPPVGLRVPLLSLPEVTLPPAELPTVTVPGTDLPAVALPRTDLPTASRPLSNLTAASPAPAIDQRAGPVDGAASGRGAEAKTAQQPLGLLAWAPTVVSAYTAVVVLLDTGMLSAIGPPAVVLLDDLGQWTRAVEVPAVGPTTALIITAAIAAATGTASAGSAGGGQAAVPAAFHLPALAGSRRLTGRMRESAFRTPRRPGFSPD